MRKSRSSKSVPQQLPAEAGVGHSGIITVAVVDDQPLFRHALIEAVLQIGGTEIVAEFDSAAEAIDAMPNINPDVCVLDLSSPEINALQVLRTCEEASASTRILMLTSDTQSEHVWKMLEEGAAGVALKTAEAEELAEAVVAVARGEAIIPERLHRGITEQIRSRHIASQPHMSEREIEILDAVAAGLSAGEIAHDLALAESTVKTHLTRIYDKLGVSERAAAVAEAMRRGLIE